MNYTIVKYGETFYGRHKALVPVFNINILLVLSFEILKKSSSTNCKESEGPQQPLHTCML